MLLPRKNDMTERKWLRGQLRHLLLSPPPDVYHMFDASTAYNDITDANRRDATSQAV